MEIAALRSVGYSGGWYVPMKYLVAVLFVPIGFAQQYEAGATIGYGVYRNGTIYSSDGSAQAGIRNRFAAGVILGDEFSEYVSGEFCYLYHDGHPFLQAPDIKSDIQGQHVFPGGESEDWEFSFFRGIAAKIYRFRFLPGSASFRGWGCNER
jgi:hypothetical protein